MAIKIKKSHKGLLHKDLGVAKDKKIPASKLKVKSTDSIAVKKRKVFAQNASHWSKKKAQDGAIMPNQLDYPDVESYQNAIGQYMASLQQELDPIGGGIKPIPQNQQFPTSTSHFQDILGQTNTQQAFQNRDMSQPLTKASSSNKKKFNWGNAAVIGMTAFDAIIPKDPIKKPVVQPQQSYNPHPYGISGSQGIMENGGKIRNLSHSYDDKTGHHYAIKVSRDSKEYEDYLREKQMREDPQLKKLRPGIDYANGGMLAISLEGYKKDSKDKNKPKLRIPSNQITMKDVPHPVMGTDNLGNQQLMMPGNDYKFPGEYVDEIPLAKMGQYISKSYEDGGYMQQGGRMPISASNPNDPRLKAYNDSLTLFNTSEANKKKYDALAKKYNLQESERNNAFVPDQKIQPVSKDIFWFRGTGYDKQSWYENGTLKKVNMIDKNDKDVMVPFEELLDINPYKGTGSVDRYKKPVQPVVYQKPQQASIKKGQPTYQDSLKLYKKYAPTRNGIAYEEKPDVMGSDIPIGYHLDRDAPMDRLKEKPIGYTKWEGMLASPVFKKPVGTPQSQEPKFKRAIAPNSNYPNIETGTGRPNPVAPNLQQANFDMSRPTKFAFTYPDYSAGEGNPTKQQKSKYFPDLQSLRAFSKGYGKEPSYGGDESWGQTLYEGNIDHMENGGELAKDGNWIKGAVNPSHKGYCTPMTKSTCTPRRKAFAMTMKKHHGFHHAEDGYELEAADGLTMDKAKEMLRDGTAKGKKLTAKQKRYFGYIAGGGAPKAGDGWLGMGYDDNGLQIEDNQFAPISDIYSEGSEHNLSESEIRDLVSQGYKIQYL